MCLCANHFRKIVDSSHDANGKINVKIDGVAWPVPWCRKSQFSEGISCFVNTRTVYIAMESMDITINTFLLAFKGSNLFSTYLTVLTKLAIVLVQRLNEIEIIHGDTHSSNFMFNFSDKGKMVFENILTTRDLNISVDKKLDFYGSFNSLKMIDFGMSRKFVKGDMEDVHTINKKFDPSFIY